MRLLERFKKARENKKGFTLVELIVVIVILGILAAILVPSFLGYMNKAKDSQAQIQARSLYLAGTTIAAENRYNLEATITNSDVDAAGGATGNAKEVAELAPDRDELETYTITIANEKVTVKAVSENGADIEISNVEKSTEGGGE